jgi:hypothetical protein
MGLISYSRRNLLTRSGFFAATPLLSPLINATGTVWFGQPSIATSGHHEAAQNGGERCLVVPLFREGVSIDIVEGDPTKPGVPYVMRIGNADATLSFRIGIQKMSMSPWYWGLVFRFGGKVRPQSTGGNACWNVWCRAGENAAFCVVTRRNNHPDTRHGSLCAEFSRTAGAHNHERIRI